MPAKKPATTNPAPATAGRNWSKVVEADETLLSVIQGGKRKGREALPSVYLDDVRNAAEHPDKAFAIRLVNGLTHTAVIAQLYKAGKQAKVKVRVFDRHDSTTPLVGFQVLPATESE